MAKPPARKAASAKARANKKAAPMAARKPAPPKRRPKPKLPTLGGGLIGMGGTGAQGMMP